MCVKVIRTSEYDGLRDGSGGMDFDRAQTFHHGPVMLRHNDWLAMDVGMTEQLVELEDIKKGKLVKAWDFYYHYS